MIFKGVEVCCPHCKADLREAKEPEASLQCMSCDRLFPVVLGIPDLRIFPDPYIDAEADHNKGRVLATRPELSFAELVDFYYSITPGVPSHLARQYTRSAMAAAARAQATLDAWEKSADADSRSAPSSLLDLGCGTGPLLVEAAPRFDRLVGVDIAFRWLVVAKKRLSEAGLDVPIICACAEALPFPDGIFDRVTAESVLEVVRDQPRALSECCRVLRAAGSLFVSTPNRYSLGPDPHLGLWGGGFLPDRWATAYARWRRGLPPLRRLLTARSLSHLICEAGFQTPRILLPEVPAGQRRHFGGLTKILIGGYHLTRSLPLGRLILRWIGPLISATAAKPAIAADVDNRVSSG
jgi:ubiquinone/menaquinone biosynthesis C-methylase UbiE/uncharacterized protein YbaR (Trm112 family)